MSSYVDLYRVYHERWSIACDALAVYPDLQYNAPDRGDLRNASVNAIGSLYRSVPLFPERYIGRWRAR
jgi:hypothetical protein